MSTTNDGPAGTFPAARTAGGATPRLVCVGLIVAGILGLKLTSA